MVKYLALCPVLFMPVLSHSFGPWILALSLRSDETPSAQGTLKVLKTAAVCLLGISPSGSSTVVYPKAGFHILNGI